MARTLTKWRTPESVRLKMEEIQAKAKSEGRRVNWKKEIKKLSRIDQYTAEWMELHFDRLKVKRERYRRSHPKTPEKREEMLAYQKQWHAKRMEKVTEQRSQERICRQCQKAYQPPKQLKPGPVPKYCSRKCQWLWVYHNSTKHRMKPKPCRECGRSFKTLRGHGLCHTCHKNLIPLDETKVIAIHLQDELRDQADRHQRAGEEAPQRDAGGRGDLSQEADRGVLHSCGLDDADRRAGEAA